MTLIVGIKCVDGVVMASDGAAQLGSVGQTTARQPTKKLSIIRERVVLGVSGPVGLGQRFEGVVEQLWDQNSLVGKRTSDAMTEIRAALWQHAGVEFRVAQATAPTLGQQLALQSVLTGTLLAFPLADEPVLFQFDHQCAPEEATHDLPFVAIGNGQQIADPFLAFLRRIFWHDKQFSLADGIFAAVWTVDHAIKTSPGGVADPKQLVVLENSDGSWRARELSKEDLEEHLQAIQGAEEHLRKYREGFSPSETSTEPGPPEPHHRGRDSTPTIPQD